MLTVLALVLAVAAPAAQAGEHLRIGTVPLAPWVEKHDVSSAAGSEFTGYIPDLLDRLASHMGFNYTLEVRDDQYFGHELDNSSWDGLIGDVLNEKIDLAAAALTETAERRGVVDFSTPFMSFQTVAILKKQKSVFVSFTDRLERIFMPCSRGAWMTLGLAYLITSAVLYVVCHVNPYEWRRLCRDQQATMREGEMSTCPNVFWFTISTFLLQGFTRAPRSLGGRVITVFWWLYIILFVIMYVSSMTNYYLRVGPTTEDDSFHKFRAVTDLASQTDVKFGVLGKGATLDKLQYSKNADLMKMSRSVLFEQTVGAGIERVRGSEPYAFITESAMAMYYAKQHPCDVYMVSEYFSTGSYSLALPLNNSRRRDFDMALLTLQHDGVLRELNDKWFVGQCTSFLLESNQRDKLKLPPFYPVDLTSISGALIILCGGLILGSIATVVEVIIFKQAEKEERGEREKLRGSQDGAYNKAASREDEPITDV